MPSRPSRALEAVPNPHPGRDYEVRCQTPEFTCVCPRTGQPDFATVTVTYVPGEAIVELKSLKLYLWSYRDEGAFHEDVTNRILDDFVAAAHPRWAEIVGDFNVRGGIKTEIRATHGKRPERPREGDEAGAQSIEPERQLQHQRQQEGAGADAKAEEQSAGNAGLEGLKTQ